MIGPLRKRKSVVLGAVAAFVGALAAAAYSLTIDLRDNSFTLGNWQLWLLVGVAVVGAVAVGVRAVVKDLDGPENVEPVQVTVDSPITVRVEQSAVEPMWRVPEPDDGVVERPELSQRLVELLSRSCSGTVGVTTALYGAGGFGKTTLVRQVAHQQQVRDRFPGGCLSVELGENLTDAELAEKVNGVSEQLCGRRPTDTDAYQAGLTLGMVLDERASDLLLVIDDVWSSDQLRPFLLGGSGCTRLVTTRRPGVLPTGVAKVWVDKMRPEQGREVLIAGLDGLPGAEVGRLLELTGQWPLLLKLANRRLRADVADGVALVAAARRMIGRLAFGGPAILDLADENSRDHAVRACVRASTDRLDSDARDRFAELAIFPAGAEVPREALTLLWGVTGGMCEVGVDRLCERLVDLSLILEYQPDTGSIRLHDVVRAFLRGQRGPRWLINTHRRFLGAAYAHLVPDGSGAAAGVARSWWRLSDTAHYLWQHLSYHLAEAGLHTELAALACDLRWITARVQRWGPAAAEADLARVDTPTADALRRGIGRAAHLLGAIQPANALTNTLLSRLENDPLLRPLCEAYAASGFAVPALINRWSLPDQPDPALCRVLRGHDGWVSGCAIAPDGSWIVTSGWDATVQMWDVPTGQRIRVLEGHDNVVLGCAVAPDGSWLVTCGWDATVRVWDAATGGLRLSLRGHSGWVSACAVAPDGSFVATCGRDGTVRIWCAATGQCWRVLGGQQDVVLDCAVVPDGSRVVTCGRDRVARVWDTATGRQRLRLAGHEDWVMACAVAGDGSFIVTAGRDGTARVWDAETGEQRLVLQGHEGPVEGCAIAPDGTLIATCGSDGTVRIWDAKTGEQMRVLKGHRGTVSRCAVAPDGGQIVSCGWDGTVRLWDVPTDPQRQVPAGHHDGAVEACAVTRDGSYIVTCGKDGTARVWDGQTGEQRRVLKAHAGGASRCAVARDGSFLVTCGWDGTARVWDAATGEQRRVLTGHEGCVLACAVAPDGTWIVTGGSDETVRMWHTETGTQLRVLEGHQGAVSRCWVAPDGTRIMSCGWDGTARIWDTVTGHERVVFHGHDGAVEGRAVAPDGTWAVTCGRDGAARVWDMTTGEQRLVLSGHHDWVYGCAVAPDGSAIVTCGSDGTVRVWDAANGECLTGIQVDGPLRDCCWQSDGSTICATGDRGLYLFSYVSPRPTR